MSFERVRAVKERFERILLWKANVVGVAVGSKLVGGRETHEPALVVFVARKLPDSQVASGDLIPRTLEGVTTDVVETGELKAWGVTKTVIGGPRTTRWRPAPGGVSLGHHGVTAGTLGCLVRRGKRVHILSNNHVLAATNRGRPGDAILQPAPLDGGGNEDLLARLESFVPIFLEDGNAVKLTDDDEILGPVLKSMRMEVEVQGEKVTNRVDCALATPEDRDEVDPEILDLGVPKGAAEGRLGMAVVKSGRTTGVKKDKVRYVGATVRVNYGMVGDALFEDQLLAGPMSRAGDSGAVVLGAGNKVVGLLFAGSEMVTVVNRIQNVLEALEVTLVTRG